MKNSWVPAFLLTGLCFLLFSCSPARNGYRRVGRQIEKEVRTSPVFNRAFTGFTLLDPETGRSLADVNGDHFFTPASTTKILTMYTCLKVLGDSVPGLQVQSISPNTNINWLFMKATGDPTFLHPSFQAWQTPFQYLKKNNRSDLVFFPDSVKVERYGPGWAWDDYPFDYQPELAAFPVYGHLARFRAWQGGFSVYPVCLRKNFYRQQKPGAPDFVRREEFLNIWDFSCSGTDTLEKWLPFHRDYDPANYLSDTLGGITFEAYDPEMRKYATDEWRTLYSTPLDTVLRRMMHQSDNFIAEQMLLVCSGQKFGYLQRDTMIKWVLDSALADLPQRPRWVDGSGLSRYDLISPQDLSAVLLHLWHEQPHETLLPLFPAGGKDGTLAGWYAGKNGEPYVFAKSGSMSGVTCLSGYVRTKHGKTLIFTFMTNHFVGSSREWKVEMQRVLERIGESY